MKYLKIDDKESNFLRKQKRVRGGGSLMPSKR
ncbi:hypothetical protein JOC33_002023 [Thalassobacillus pellis]|nr:hypothetical protein [Thalassobacillus pellis]